MANLVDTSVNGDLRVTGKVYGTANAVRVNTANLAIPPLGNGDQVGSTGDFFLDSGSGKGLPNTTDNFNIHTTVTHFNGTTYRLTQIATPTSASNPAGIYERGASSSDGVTWTFGSWLAAANSSHTHGNIANGGTLTDTAAAASGNDYVVIRDADNAKIQTSTIKGTDVADAVSKKHSHSTLTLSTTAQAYDGTHTLALPSSDPYTSARTPASHASSATTYGVGTTANYGHVKLATGDMNGATHADGVAVSKNHTHGQYVPTTRKVNGHALSADVTVTAADVSAVRYDTASQGLTDTQKSNARTNIGAGTSNLTLGTTSTTAAKGDHTHTTSIASDSSSGTVVTLAHNTQYKLTAGGTSVLFKTPADSNTDTKQRIVASDSKTYLTGVTTAPTSSNQDLTGVANANVYATAGQLHATTFDVNSKCTLQFNTTTNALDFVFA